MPLPPSILPGATIGVLGSGQLGRMFTLAARKMGYRVHTFSPDTDTPTGQVADLEIVADYEDLDAVARFAQAVDVVTFEFENVSSAATAAAEKFAPVRPAGRVLHTTQHRLREKTFLRDKGFPVTRFAPVKDLPGLHDAITHIGLPAILKSAGFGYDGKGQARLTHPDQAQAAWHAVTSHSGLSTPHSALAILEAMVDFDREVSVVAARGLDGSFAHWGVVENDHVNGILDLTIAPARVSDAVARQAVDIARGIFESLDVVGVMCVEFFLARDGRLLVNELAPRPHNSGHLTFDASVTSQFEQQLRAVCGLPLGDTRLHAPAAMAQLLGDIWPNCPSPTPAPNWPAALKDPRLKLHLYGKAEPRKGRKMGHLTAMAPTVEEARAAVLAARAVL